MADKQKILDDVILKLIRSVAKTNKIVRKEGLLGLDIYASELSDDTFERYLKMMLYIIADGTDADVFSEICLLRYYRNNFSGLEAIQYLLYFLAALLIQKSTKTQLIEQVLIQFLSEKEMIKYLRKMDCLREIDENQLLSEAELETIFSKIENNKDGKEELIFNVVDANESLDNLEDTLNKIVEE